MNVPAYGLSMLGGANPIIQQVANAGITTYAMAALNTGWCASFLYRGTALRDVATVYVFWSGVATPGTVQVRIETDNAGKPSGTLYDANAVLSFTPVAGWQALTFAVAPSTHLTDGNYYHVVLLTTVAGTTQTLGSQVGLTLEPTVLQTAADGTLRSNFAQVGGACPVMTLVFTDAAEETFPFSQYSSANSYPLLNNSGYGALITLTASIKCSGVFLDYLTKTGTPTGSLRCRVLDSTDALVDTAEIVPVGMISTGKKHRFFFSGGARTLAAGSYRIIFDNASHTDTGGANAYALKTAVARVAGNTPANCNLTSATDVTVAHPTWTNTSTEIPPMGFILADGVVAASSGGLLVNPGMAGGMRG